MHSSAENGSDARAQDLLEQLQQHPALHDRIAALLAVVENTDGRAVKAAEAGAGQRTHLHCVGDGASWIVGQVKQFGSQARYLVDFYHVSEYLAGAATSIAGAGSRDWLHRQQGRLKENGVGEVLAELARHREAESVAVEAAVVRRCARYLASRRACLDYAGAFQAGLPIGSGEIAGIGQ